MKDLMMSRKFWAAILMLAMVVIGTFVPGFTLDTDEAAGMLIVVVTYILGVAVDPGYGGWAGVFQSRKFWAAIVGFIIMWLNAFNVVLPFSLSPEQIIIFAVTMSGYIAGVAVEQPKPVNPE